MLYSSYFSDPCPYRPHFRHGMDAGRLAKELNVKTLLLYHTEDANLAERKERYTKEAMQMFDGAVLVPDDLERISIT